MSDSDKAPLRLLKYDELAFIPRFEYGDMAEVVELCGPNDGTELGVGFGRLTNAYFPWTIQYDEVLTVIEGNIRIHANGEIKSLDRRDSIWMPKGTEVIFEAESALVLFAIHPANWFAD